MRLQARPLTASIFSTLVVVLLLLSAQSAAAAVVTLTADQMVQLSHHIVVAVVERQQSRWNERHTLIVTDYYLRIEERLRGEAPDQVTLTMPGGTFGGETHDTSVTTHLLGGSRYLLFCRDLERTHLAPITGVWQGVFREVRTAEGKSAVVPGSQASPMTSSTGQIRFTDFVAAVRDLVQRRPASASGDVLPGWLAESKLPAKKYAPLAAHPDAEHSQPPAGAVTSPGAIPPHDAAGNLVPDSSGLITSPETSIRLPPGLDYLVQRRPSPPVIFNQLAPSITPWAPNDQTMMAYWNIYANGLFRVYQQPTGTWAWGNGVYDIAGFPPDADMLAQFGAAWSPGELAVTYSRWFGNGPIVESDIAANPHYAWTLDEAFATAEGSPAWSFRETMLHELGHAWGLQHPWETQRVWWDSIMNYSPKEFRSPRLFADDAAAARAAYPGLSIHDGLLSAYITDFNPNGSNQAIYEPSAPIQSTVAAGGSFQMTQPLTVENVGTDDLVDPVVEVYLTPNRFSFANSVPLTTLHYTGTVHSYSVQRLSIGNLSVPSGAPSGQYAVAFFLRDNSDGLQYNNGTWTTSSIQVQGGPAPCAPNANTACLLNGRFKATVRFRGDFTNNPADTQALVKSVTGFANANFETSFFYFNDPNNIELLLKMLDQGNKDAQGHLTIAVLFGSASPLRVELTITDTKTGAVRTYASNLGTLAGAADFVAFVK